MELGAGLLLGAAAVLLLIVAGVLVLLTASLWRLYAALCLRVDASAATVVRTAVRGVGATPDPADYFVLDTGPEDAPPDDVDPEEVAKTKQQALDATPQAHHAAIIEWFDQDKGRK
jgi:hypothetical protein